MKDVTSMNEVTLYGTATCPYCVRAEALLQRKSVSFHKIRIDQSETETATMIARSGRRTVPQIFIGERHVGGYTELAELERTGELAQLLETPHG